MFGIVRGIFRLGLLGTLLAAGGGGYGYYRYAASKLPAAPEAVVAGGVCRATPSLSGGTLPLTFEAYVKDAKEHNWLSSEAIGLVKARYEWSHGAQAWVEDRAFADRQASAVPERQKLARREIDALIADLESDDVIRREIAAKELLIRTGETRGYRYDAPAADRAAAVAEWKKWWADDRTKMKYGARRAIDYGQKALDALRRALGEPEEPPQPGGTR
jgi:hypothetical protein